MWPPHNPITYSPLYGGRISSYLCKYMLSLDMAQDSTMTGSWPSWWYLSWSRASPASNGPGATLSWQGCFQSQGQSTSHLSSCFPLPRLPSQDFFRIVTSHIWHRSIFGGAACAIRSIPGKLLRPCQPSISLCQRTNYVLYIFHFPAGCRYICRQFWPLMLRVCYGDYHGPIEGEQSSIERMNLCPRTPDNHAGQRGWRPTSRNTVIGIIVVEPTCLHCWVLSVHPDVVPGGHTCRQTVSAADHRWIMRRWDCCLETCG